jgi:2-dehydropantoate 2-reductase
MKIAIIGSGAMGGVFGGLLAQGGHDVTLVDIWQEGVDAINQRGLRIDDKAGASETVKVRATTNASDAGVVDLVLVFVKCYHTEAAVTAAKGIIGPKTAVLSLQNGWGNAGRIAAVVGADKVLVGVTYHSATLAGAGHVQHMAKGMTHMGGLGGAADMRLPEIAAAFTRAGIETQVSPTIREQIWSKLALNVCSLPTSSLLNCYAGDLVQRPGTVALMQNLLREVVAVATELGIKLDYQERWTAISTLLEKAATAKASMLQDVLAKRRTEIDVINGAIIAEGGRLGLATPCNEALVHLIKALEDGYGRPPVA